MCVSVHFGYAIICSRVGHGMREARKGADDGIRYSNDRDTGTDAAGRIRRSTMLSAGDFDDGFRGEPYRSGRIIEFILA